jgi:acyl-CoA reductase-like NAD-dependent aldehyde dehydrogenase
MLQLRALDEPSTDLIGRTCASAHGPSWSISWAMNWKSTWTSSTKWRRSIGRPARETRAQIRKVPDLFRYNAGLALTKRDAVIPVEGNYLAYTLRRPVGVVANITPFNHPLLIAPRNLAPTLASCCTTVIKPSEYTPLTTLRMAEIFSAAGLPPPAFSSCDRPWSDYRQSLVQPSRYQRACVDRRDRVRPRSRSGCGRPLRASDVGARRQSTGPRVRRLRRRPRGRLRSLRTFIAAGQTCICSSRHLVQRSIYAEFVEKLAIKAKGITVGRPFDKSTQMGPLVSEKRQRVQDTIKIGIAKGARLVAGGNVPAHLKSSKGFYLEPTVFADVGQRCASRARKCLDHSP